MNSLLLKEEKRKIIELICDKQTRMIIENPASYINEEYMGLEALKIVVKDLKTKEGDESEL